MTGIPKKVKAYIDESGNILGLGKLSGSSHQLMVSSSGTLRASDGFVTLSGGWFKPTSVILGSYIRDATWISSWASAPQLAFVLADGTTTISGLPGAQFYYTVFNTTL